MARTTHRDKLYKKLLERGVPRAEIARRLGVSRQAVSKWAQRHGMPRILDKPLIAQKISKQVEFHLECARNLNQLAQYLIREVELLSLENASKTIDKLIKEMRK
jgi:predicted transcriptional regulator